MNKNTLLTEIQSGEDSTCQFKADVKNVDSLASEMVAFSNSLGGTIFIGVDDNGKIRPKRECLLRWRVARRHSPYPAGRWDRCCNRLPYRPADRGILR